MGTTPKSADFPSLFGTFRQMLKKYEKQCETEVDSDTEYYLNLRKPEGSKKAAFFAGVSVNKASVSFYLMPVHSLPELLRDASPGLRSHLHGHCCFRFQSVDPDLLDELGTLTKECYRASRRSR